MVLNEFDKLFEIHVAQPLRDEGFEYVPKTKTMVLSQKNSQLALIRLGGKYSRQGAINQIICFRHDFLRTINGEDTVSTTTEPNDYPYKFILDDFRPSSGFIPIIRRTKYKPINLGIRETELLHFSDKPINEVKKKLSLQANIIIERIIPWAQKMHPKLASSEIKQFGEDAWCEKRWLEDYDRILHEAS